MPRINLQKSVMHMKHFLMIKKEGFMIKWDLLEMNKLRQEKIHFQDSQVFGILEAKKIKIMHLIFLVSLTVFLELEDNKKNKQKELIFIRILKLLLWNRSMDARNQLILIEKASVILVMELNVSLVRLQLVVQLVVVKAQQILDKAQW